MSDHQKETTALLGYRWGVDIPPRVTHTPPTPPRSVFEVPEASPMFSKREDSSPGINMVTAVCYILGVFGVVPIVSLPGAIIYCGWSGFVLFGVLVLIEVYTAVLLCRSWLMMEVFWPREAVIQR
ncbi:uncharacterized protein LOC121864557, partial [Homarus americanus]|uniref:uncharacterized protein LOC121864557 n=1 Tax=Homarus americanus TaxID=6706 RepID=UPI001C43AF04